MRNFKILYLLLLSSCLGFAQIKKDYKTQFIQSNFGVIQAVPSLKLRRTRDIRKKSYLGYNGEIPAKIKWEKMIARFEIEIEYEK
jgi:hypothetical protein